MCVILQLHTYCRRPHSQPDNNSDNADGRQPHGVYGVESHTLMQILAIAR